MNQASFKQHKEKDSKEDDINELESYNCAIPLDDEDLGGTSPHSHIMRDSVIPSIMRSPLSPQESTLKRNQKQREKSSNSSELE